VIIERGFKPFPVKMSIRPLNSSLQAIAKDQLFEEPDKIQESLEILKEWIKKSPHLRVRTNDQFLIVFLRGCKYSMERAKQKLDMFYTTRTHIPELFRNRDPLNPITLNIIKLGGILPLEPEHPGAPRMLLFRGGCTDPHLYPMNEVMKVSCMLNDILMIEDDNSSVAGQIGVMDLAGMTLQHFIQMQPAFMKKITVMVQEGVPIRQKGFHYINAPAIFEQVFNMFKSLLNEKMRSRVRNFRDYQKKLVSIRYLSSFISIHRLNRFTKLCREG